MDKGVTDLAAGALKTLVFKKEAARRIRTFLSAQQRSASLRREHAVDGLTIPPFLIASITKNCNLQCKGCYAHANDCHAGVSAPLSAQRWETIFYEAQALGVSYILLAGGEPLMRPDVLEKAAGIQGIMFPVFTNGILLDDAYVKFFEKNRNLVPVISLEGGEEATDARRGTGVFEKTAAAMRILKKKRILFGVSITFTRENVFDITRTSFAKMLQRKGAGILFYVEYVPADGISDHLAPDTQSRAILENRMNMLRRTTRLLLLSFPGEEDFTDGCLAAGRGFVHINHNGNVEPCPFSPYSDINVANASLKEALASPFLKKVREQGMTHGEHNGGCMLWERREDVARLLNNSL
jgi:MoaA/NifB/PqqE/SkfB family radical SAM enzyme